MTYVLVESDFSDRPERVVVVRPCNSIVEDVVAILLGLLNSHDLHRKGICGIVSFLDGIEQVLYVVVGLCTRKSQGFLGWEVGHSGVWLDVPLDVMDGTVLLDELVRVDAKSVDVAQR